MPVNKYFLYLINNTHFMFDVSQLKKVPPKFDISSNNKSASDSE